MKARVIETTVEWRHRETGVESSVRYFTATSDDWLGLAFMHTDTLTSDDVDALTDYERACADGVAQILTNSQRKVV